MRRIHLLFGIALVILFLLSGTYMHVRYDHLRGFDDATRLLFRSTHIYLLFHGLLHTALGLYLVPRGSLRARRVQDAGSLVLLVAPLLALAAFLEEPLRSGLARTWTRPAVYLVVAGMALHLVAALVPPGSRETTAG